MDLFAMGFDHVAVDGCTRQSDCLRGRLVQRRQAGSERGVQRVHLGGSTRPISGIRGHETSAAKLPVGTGDSQALSSPSRAAGSHAR